MDYFATSIDFISFLLLGTILVMAFIIPSREKILGDGIKLPEWSKKLQLLVGIIAVGLATVLGVFSVIALSKGIPSMDDLLSGSQSSVRTVILSLNTLTLGGLGILHITNNFRIRKVLDSQGSSALMTDDAVEEDTSDNRMETVTAVEEDLPEVLTIQCPECNNTLKITVKKRPAKITCPVCGLKGEV